MNHRTDTPAISLEKFAGTAPALLSKYEAAGISLTKRGFTGKRAAVYLVLDRSGSMRGYYKDGSVQKLAEQILGLAAHLDDDGIVPTVFFSTDVHTHSTGTGLFKRKTSKTADITLDDYQGRIDTIHRRLGHMGTTNYVAAMKAVIEHHQAHAADTPALVIFQTDGSPDERAKTTELLRDVTGLPIFWQFVGFGPEKDERGKDRFAYLRKLDETVQGRVRDNANFFPAGPSPKNLPDEDLYDQLTEEFPSWYEAVQNATTTG